MVIDCTFTWLALHTVDEYLDRSTISSKTEIIAVLLLFCIDIAIDNREKNKN
ncbi:YrvL family regulatory protein [Bacillus sp. X1(2014)]|uniref:YrvL family regulatory protein n=1 Tax=Bacillus sp. X1(2014) TaxID=1565991 RepID=UPI0011A4DF4B